MPHVIIEYSANVAEHHDIDELVEVVHDAVVANGIGPHGGVRTRAIVRDHYRQGRRSSQRHDRDGGPSRPRP